MFNLLISCFILGVSLHQCNGGAYTIVASKELRPLSEYRVAVSRTADGAGAINLELEGHGFREAQLATMDPYSTAIVTFKTGALNQGEYTLSARSVYGDKFFETATIIARNKTYCVFLHTDKTVYQASDIIMFRLLVLNKHLKPLANIRPGMILKDGNHNVLKQWDKLPLTKGVFSEEVQISDFPVLGEWTFEIEVNGQMYKKKILVADYVLPKFNLKIETPEHIYYPDGSIPVTITAQRFSGEEVEGELTVTAYPMFYSGVIQPVFQSPLRRVEHMKGRLSLQLALGAELQLREGEAAAGAGGRRLVLEAALEEALTGRRHNVSALLWLHRTRSYISHQAPAFYNPGLPYILQARVVDWEELGNHDGEQLVMKYGFPTDRDGTPEMTEVRMPLGPDGKVTFIIHPDGGTPPKPMTIELLYNDLREVITNILPPSGPRANLMQLTLITPTPTVNNDIHVKINSTAPMRTLTYYVMGRGEIIFAKTFQIIPARRMDELKFQATHAMAPEAVLMVCHVSETFEMEIVSLQFKVTGILQNNVDLYLSPEEPEPLGNVELRVSAEPDSYVAFMASAPSPMFSAASDHHFLAGQGSGLSMETVLSEVRSFSPVSSELKHLFKEISHDIAGDTVNQLGIILLTDNLYNKGNPENLSKRPDDTEMELSTRSPLSGPYAFSRYPVPPAPRVFLGALPTTAWLFSNITVGLEGKGLLGRRLPANPGADWGVGAWAVHPSRGLGLAQPRRPRSVPRPTLRASAPRSLREGELLALPASLSNPTDREVQAEITLHNLRQDFRFQTGNELDTPNGLELYQRQKVSVSPGHAGTVVFFISILPSNDGPRMITFQLTATGVGLADSHELEINVSPAGEEETSDDSDMLNLSSGSALGNLSVAAPPRGRVRRPTPTVLYRASAWGWPLAPALAQLPQRAKLPPASGYHNMLPYMEAAVLLQSLDNSAQLSEAVRASCMELMKKIYQQQLAYLQADGSFSLFKNPFQEGSIWVTGFTARWFGTGMGTSRRDVGIPASTVREALQWLAARQQADGNWKEADTVTREDPLQQDPLVLTALTLFTFLDTKHLTLSEYGNVMNKAQDWLARHVPDASSQGAATLAPLAAVLAAAHHPAAFQATNILNSMANVSEGIRWWDVETPNPLRERGRGGRGVSTAAWAAQALLRQGLSAEAAQLARPLLGALRGGARPGPLLPALAGFASRAPVASAATLEFRCPANNDTTMLNVNKGNYLLVQDQQVRDRQCSVFAQGSGAVVAALRGVRRTNVTAPWPRFTLDPRVDSTSTAHHLQLTICVGFVTETGEDTSGPVLLEMRLPSGFDIDIDLPALLASGKVRSGLVGETLQLILAPLGPRETCLTLGAPRLHAVAKEHPGVITVRDLDDESRRARVFFSPGGESGLCDVCWAERCRGPCVDLSWHLPPLQPRGQVATSFFPDEDNQEKLPSSSIRWTAFPVTVALVLVFQFLLSIL